jgi:phosphoserine phosphatase
MRTAVFDFDETLVYLHSALIWSKHIHLRNILKIPKLLMLGKFNGALGYHRKAFEWMVGKDVSRTIETMKSLPPIPGAVNYFRQLSARGYKMIVMSYSPGVFVSPWLAANGLESELICPDFVVKANMLKTISNDPVTRTYLAELDRAKAKVLSDLDIRPDICVGDNARRDRMCDQYIDIRNLEPGYHNIIKRTLRGLEHVFR